ncbi:MAG TPA: hypothetical protein VGM12_13575, partial [Trebonia sp.]
MFIYSDKSSSAGDIPGTSSAARRLLRGAAERGGWARRLGAHVVACPGHDVGQLPQVSGGERREQHLAGDLHVARQDTGEPRAAGGGEGDQGGALVVRAGRAGDQ